MLQETIQEWREKYATTLVDIDNLLLINARYADEITSLRNTVEELRIEVASLEIIHKKKKVTKDSGQKKKLNKKSVQKKKNASNKNSKK